MQLDILYFHLLVMQPSSHGAGGGHGRVWTPPGKVSARTGDGLDGHPALFTGEAVEGWGG